MRRTSLSLITESAGARDDGVGATAAALLDGAAAHAMTNKTKATGATRSVNPDAIYSTDAVSPGIRIFRISFTGTPPCFTNAVLNAFRLYAVPMIFW